MRGRMTSMIVHSPSELRRTTSGILGKPDELGQLKPDRRLLSPRPGFTEDNRNSK